MGEEIIGAATEHEHLPIRTGARGVPQSTHKHTHKVTHKTQTNGQTGYEYTPGAPRMCVFHLLPLISCGTVQPSVTYRSDQVITHR